MGEQEKKEDNAKHIDVSLAPYGKAVDTATKGAVDGAGAFLSRICLPVAEEFGLFLKDKVHEWRSRNVIKTLEKAEQKYKEIHGDSKYVASPRLLSSVVENASWTDNDEVQDMWAGLLVSSCSEDGMDDSNVIFVNLLSQLTHSQARILNYACVNTKKRLTKAGWFLSQRRYELELDRICEITGISEFHRIDLELDHLRSLQLIASGFPFDGTVADVSPTPLALQLYVRCQGFTGPPNKYFGIEEITP